MTCLPSHDNDSHERLRTEIRELSTEDSKNFFLFADFDSTKESQKIFEKLDQKRLLTHQKLLINLDQHEAGSPTRRTSSHF
jgi:hypothetical protein